MAFENINVISLKNAINSCINSINYNFLDESNYLIIFKGVSDVLKYLKADGLMDELIISNTDSNTSKWEVTAGVFISDEDEREINAVKEEFNVNIVYKAIS